MRNFFYAAAGIFLLALAFQLGSTTATAQVAGQFVGLSCMDARNELYAITADGRVYCSYGFDVGSHWVYRGSASGAPVPATQQSWGQVRDRYR